MDCRILGPVEITHNDRVLRLGSTKEAHLLAALAYEVGRPVPLDRLVRRLWDDEPPGSPLSSLYANATSLRRHLRSVQAGDGPAPCVNRASGAYTLEADPEIVDWHRFRRLVSQARELADSGEDDRALELFRRAEALWRGEPLSGLGGLWAASVRTSLREQRDDAVIARTAVELRLGRFDDVAGELSEVLPRRPTDEMLIGQLMIAHHGRGRHADALRLYAGLRRRLRAELGSEPGPDLARTHELILSHAPVSTLLPALRPQQPAPPPPNTLPRHTQVVGREREMRTLLDRLDAAPGRGAVVALQSISGMAGVGKSLLAWSVAERLADRFPEGQVHLDLRAHAPMEEPVTPSDALARLLRTLGVAPKALAATVEELTALWRTTMAKRRMVIVLDDASGPEQIRPLLPGSSPSLVLITSRRRMSGLPGVRSLTLDVLSAQDAVALFRRMVEDDRADDPEEVARIVALCGYLPLAIEIAASRLNSRPNWSLAHLIRRLSREHTRLEELRDSDREIAVVFYVSYATLTVEERTVFRLVSLHLTPDFGPHSAAAVTGLSLSRVERVLDTLVDAHLLQVPAPDRYRFHDLLNEFAINLTAAEDSAGDRESAMHRLIDFYIAAADAADRMVRPGRLRLDIPVIPGLREWIPAWQDAAEAEGWLMAEHLGLINAARYARTHRRPDQAAFLGHVMAGFLEAGGFWSEAEDIHRHAVHYWHETGEPVAEVRARIELGRLYANSGRYQQAMGVLDGAVAIAAETGDTAAELEVLHELGILHWHQGRFDAALAVQREVLALREKEGDRRQIARCLNNIAITSLYTGRYGIARITLCEALREFQAIDDPVFQRRVLNNLADLDVRIGDTSAARQSLEKARSIGIANADKSDLAVMDITLASALEVPERLDEALTLLRRALESSRELGDLRNQAICLNEMGRTYRKAGRPEDAVGLHARALDLARHIDTVIDEVQSLLLLGTAERLLGRHRSAIGRLREALRLAGGAHLPVEEAEAAAELDRAQSEAKCSRSA